MKYFLLNKEEVRKDIETHPIVYKTKSHSKIVQYRNLLKKIEKLKKEITKELRDTNNIVPDDMLNTIFENSGEEITTTEYNTLRVIPLYDNVLQKLKAYNKTNILKGKLYGKELKEE